MSLLVSTNKQNDLFCYHNSVNCNSSCNRQIYLSLVWYSHVIGSKKLPCISVVPKHRSFSRTQQIQESSFVISPNHLLHSEKKSFYPSPKILWAVVRMLTFSIIGQFVKKKVKLNRATSYLENECYLAVWHTILQRQKRLVYAQ